MYVYTLKLVSASSTWLLEYLRESSQCSGLKKAVVNSITTNIHREWSGRLPVFYLS